LMATSDGRYQDAWPDDGPRRESSVLLLADDYFCIAVDEHSGRPRASPRVTGFGLAAALLAELVLSGRLEIQADQVHPIDGNPPADALSGWVHGQMVSHPQHCAPQTWLEFLGPRAVDAVARRLASKQIVQVVAQRRRLRREEVIYPALDHTAVVVPGIRIANRLSAGEPLEPRDMMCLALCAATGLVKHVLWDPQQHRDALGAVPDVLARLPGPLISLRKQLEVVVGTAVLTNRS
jgi:hypothetical protein